MSSFHDLLFRTDDPSRWGDGIGRNLQPQEIDLNFWILLSLITDLQNNPSLPKNISEITVADGEMTIVLDDEAGTTFGPFTLPVATFTWRDNWTPATTYAKFDLFNQANGLYLVLQNHTSNGSFDANDGNVGGPFYKLLIAYPVAMDIGFFFPGLPGTGIEDDAPIFSYLAARPFYLKTDLPETVGASEIEFDADTSFPILKNADQIGTMDFAAGEKIPTFTFADDVQFDIGDKLMVLKPTAIDATGADLNVTFAAIKGLIEAPSSEAASSS